MEEILKIDNLHVSFDTYAGEVHAVRGVSLEVNKGEVLAIVGESGCGKSVTAQTIMKLNPMPPARIKEGSIKLCGKDIVAASEKEMQDIRGQMVSMIFQDPMTCMNPTMRVGKQLTETLVNKKKISKADAEKEAEAWAAVGSATIRRISPHEIPPFLAARPARRQVISCGRSVGLFESVRLQCA